MKRLLSILSMIMLCLGLPSAVALASSTEPVSVPEETNSEEIELITETIDISTDGSALEDVLDMDNEDLFAGYLNETLGDELFSVDGTTAEALGCSLVRANMDSWELAVYDALLAKVPSIADGTETSTVFTTEELSFTAEELGVENLLQYNSETKDYDFIPTAAKKLETRILACVQKALAAAMHTCPYEMYWFNKQSGYSISMPLTAYATDGTVTIIVNLSVIDTYKGTGDYVTDKTKTAAAAQVAANAKNIVADAKNLSDEEKITFYRNAICDAVSYYQTQSSGVQTYGDPWQLIYVFDGDSSTNVYCEGYAKAFQYLCDLTEFDDDSIYCITATGTMDEQNHMWNVIHWGDGLNYMADITNCDDGQIGYPNNLLRVRTDVGDLNDGYTFLNCLYTYDTITRSIFQDSALILHTVAGDFNGNGSVGADDLVFLIKYILDMTENPMVCTDVNNSRGTDLADVVHLMRYLMGEAVTLYR